MKDKVIKTMSDPVCGEISVTVSQEIRLAAGELANLADLLNTGADLFGNPLDAGFLTAVEKNISRINAAMSHLSA